MKTYIALLRGINVGGQKKLKMADLKLLFEQLGFEAVTTYIQTGNVVFTAKEGASLAARISKEIHTKFGFEVPVLIKTASEIENILANCPFGNPKQEASYFVLLETPPTQELVQATELLENTDEEFVITDSCVYMFCATGYGKTKLNNNLFEKKLKVAATTRNYRTLAKLVELAK
ncbi:MAG TPA: DUF1697 domain-containing protein [Aequorivita sp.]|nr:DUF1697 domain-containing protein [Aequorivita sp.]